MKNLKKTRGWLVMAAALTLGLSACSSSEDSIIEQPANPTEKTYTMTVKANKGEDNALARAIAAAGSDGETRALALSSDGKSITATWKTGDAVQVYKVLSPGQPDESESATPDGTLNAQSDGATTTLSGSFREGFTPKAGDVYRLRYLPDPVYSNQEGTLDYIATHCDYAVALITVQSVDETTKAVTATGVADFANQQAIVKFSLKQNSSSESVVARELKVKVGTGSRIYTATLATPASVVYLAIPDVSNEQVTLTATGDDGAFTYERSGVTFTKGQFYAIGVNMTCTKTYVNLAKISSDITVTDGQVVAGTLGGKHKISIAEGATVTLKNVTIDRSSSNSEFAGITCLGTATINLEGTNTVKAPKTSYPAIQAGPTETTLTIGGTGSLIVTGLTSAFNVYNVAIGSKINYSCGNLCFEGGSITATGGYNCAAIGASHSTTSSPSNCGNITITGGHIIARGGGFSNAIGCSHTTVLNSTRCGDITISGGTVEATGGMEAAAIGSSNKGACGNITISGGTGTATKGNSADCAIGKSYIDDGGSMGTIKIANWTYYNGSTFTSNDDKAFLMQNSISWGN